MPETAAIRRKLIREEIFNFLHERILAGRYRPGEWLRQEDISSQLGVSMTPVREALDLLVSAGMAERIPYRGVRILQPSTEEILNSYGLRLLLESAAVYATAININEEQLLALQEILDRSTGLVRLEDMSLQRRLSRELHAAIVSASGNSLLYKMYLTVLNTFPDWLLYEYMFRHPELLANSISSENREHTAIVDAVAKHQPQLAVREAVEHLTNRGRELETYLGVPRNLIQEQESMILPLITNCMLSKKTFKEEFP